MLLEGEREGRKGAGGLREREVFCEWQNAQSRRMQNRGRWG